MNTAIRHYGTMQDLEEAHKLPMTEPCFYGELHPSPVETVQVQKAPLRSHLPASRRMSLTHSIMHYRYPRPPNYPAC